MSSAILQSRLFDAPWGEPSFRRLPGLRPCPDNGWILVDEVFAAQMAARARLLDERPHDVLAMTPAGEAGASECLNELLGILPAHGFQVQPGAVRRPDGEVIEIEADRPLWTMGRLVQEDICVLTREASGWELSAAVLCFPAGWMLNEKLGRHMTRIHAPVNSYDGELSRRVDRLLDGIKPGLPVWRANLHRYESSALFAATPEAAPRPPADGDAPYLRSERQCLVKLPRTGAIAFTIHTFVVDRAAAPDLP